MTNTMTEDQSLTEAFKNMEQDILAGAQSQPLQTAMRAIWEKDVNSQAQELQGDVVTAVPSDRAEDFLLGLS